MYAEEARCEKVQPDTTAGQVMATLDGLRGLLKHTTEVRGRTAELNGYTNKVVNKIVGTQPPKPSAGKAPNNTELDGAEVCFINEFRQLVQSVHNILDDILSDSASIRDAVDRL